MFEFASMNKNKNKDSSSEENEVGVAPIHQKGDAGMRMDAQIKEMKELSDVTIATIEKIKKLKVDEIGGHLLRIDERILKLEEHVRIIDQKLASGCNAGTEHESGCRHEDKIMAVDEVSGGSAANECKSPGVPQLPMSRHESIEELSHVIETTMDKKKLDDVSKTIINYENDKKTDISSDKGNIFTKMMSKVMPKKKSESIFVKPKADDDGSAAPTINESAMHDIPLSKPVSHEAVAVETEEAREAGHVDEECAPVLKNPGVDLLELDKNELRPQMDEMLSTAKNMLVMRKYSDATEVYLKLSDAYEKNKDDASIQELGVKIDELYEGISSNLLSNLMTTDTGKKTSVFDKER